MWEKINRFVHSHTVLSVFLLSALIVFTLTVFGISIFGMTPSIRLAVFTIGQLVLFCIVVWLMRKLEVFDINDFRFKEVGKGLLLAWFGIVFIVISFIINFTQIPANSFIAPNVFYLMIVVLHPFIGTSLFEEVLFRGLVFKILLRKTGDSKRGIVFACVVSSLLFGLVHIFNILAGAPVLPTASNVISAAASGVFFAAVFYRTRKLLIPILFHGFLNLSHQIYDALVSPDRLLQSAESQAGINITWSIIFTLFGNLAIIIAGLVLLRNVRPDGIPNEKTYIPSRK